MFFNNVTHWLAVYANYSMCSGLSPLSFPPLNPLFNTLLTTVLDLNIFLPLPNVHTKFRQTCLPISLPHNSVGNSNWYKTGVGGNSGDEVGSFPPAMDVSIDPRPLSLDEPSLLTSDPPSEPAIELQEQWKVTVLKSKARYCIVIPWHLLHLHLDTHAVNSI